MPSWREGTRNLELQESCEGQKATMGFEPMMRVLQAMEGLFRFLVHLVAKREPVA